MSWFSFFMSLSVCVTAAKQLVVTGSDTALRVSVYSVPAITRQSATVNKSQPAIFLSLKTYFTTIKICSVISTFPDSLSDIHVCIQERLGFFHYAFSVFLIVVKLCYIAAEIWNEKENWLLYRIPVWTGSLTSCMSQGTGCRGLTKIHGPTEV